MGAFNFVTGFLVGLYSGLYVAKNYNVPDVPSPQLLFDKAKSWAEANKKSKDD